MADTMVASPVKTDHCSRKNKKPLMEKRRRARINSCLSQLKSLVLQAIKKDSSQFSKLEKADILELTVKHLRALQRQQAAGVMGQDSHVVSKYRAGFNECAKEVVRYMGSVREVNEEVKERVVSHLANCLQVVNQFTPMETLQQHHHHHHHQQQQPQQPPMKPLHVHIPPQPAVVNACVTSVAPSVIMHTAAVSQTALASGLGGYTHPSPLRPITTSSSSSSSSPSSSSSSSASSSGSQDCHHHHHHQTPSPVSATSALAALPLQSAAALTTTAAGTAAVVSPTTPSPISGAFKLVPSGAGTVAVYVGTTESVPRARDSVSVDAVPLYSVALPPNPHHPNATAALAAFVTPPPTSHVTSPDPRYEDVSPVKAEYSPLSAAALPVDLRQMSKVKAVDEAGPCPSLSAGQCSPALADDKLWRPW